MIQAVDQASKEGKRTADEIAPYYSGLTGNNIEIEQPEKRLHEVEKSGLIRKEITNSEDEPILTWGSVLDA